jgi:transcriptional regulator with XRE-family HTH domain
MGGEVVKAQLKRLREKAGLTQEQLGQKLGVGQSTVGMWETGERLPRADKLPELAKILGCTIDDLLKPDETRDTQSR